MKGGIERMLAPALLVKTQKKIPEIGTQEATFRSSLPSNRRCFPLSSVRGIAPCAGTLFRRMMAHRDFPLRQDDPVSSPGSSLMVEFLCTRVGHTVAASGGFVVIRSGVGGTSLVRNISQATASRDSETALRPFPKKPPSRWR